MDWGGEGLGLGRAGGSRGSGGSGSSMDLGNMMGWQLRVGPQLSYVALHILPKMLLALKKI